MDCFKCDRCSLYFDHHTDDKDYIVIDAEEIDLCKDCTSKLKDWFEECHQHKEK